MLDILLQNKSATAYEGLSSSHLWNGTGNTYKVTDAAEATSLFCTANDVNQTLLCSFFLTDGRKNI